MAIIPYSTLPKPPMGSPLNVGHWSTDRLVGFWPFINSDRLIDYSNNKIDGVITGAVWAGNGLVFSGTDDEAAMSLPSTLIAGGPITIVVSARQTTLDLEGLVNVQAAPGDPGQIGSLYLSNSSMVFWCRDRISSRGQQSTTIDTNIWHQYICTHAGGAVRGNIYIDGVLNNTDSSVALSNFGDNVIQIGAGFVASLDFTGNVSYCYIYARVLTPSEINQLYLNPYLPIQDQSPIPTLYGAEELTTNYSSGDETILPANDDDDLENSFTEQNYIDVATDDGVRVNQSSTGEYSIFLFKNKHTQQDTITLNWNGQSDISPSAATIYLQIFNRNTTSWETLDSDNTTSADTDFTLTGVQSANLSDYFDGNFWVSWRVYQ